MIDVGEIVVILGDQRLFAGVDGGRIVDAWTVNALGYSSRAEEEVRAAIERIDGSPMFLRNSGGARPRELSSHERMWALSQLRARLVLAKIDREAAARHPEQTAEIERMLGERDGAGLD